MEKGKIIVIEGACDGMGKSTQTALLLNYLNQHTSNIFTHHFPSYERAHAQPVVSYLSGEFGQIKDLSPYFIHSLYAVDRAAEWNLTLKKHYETGATILLDRYTTSSIIYQSAGITNMSEKKAFIDFVCEYEYEKLKIGKPDQVLFLHADFELITEIRNKRKSNEGVEKDIHERDISFMRNIYDNAMFVADYLGWDMLKCDNNHTLKTKEEIHEDIKKLVKI